MKKSPYLIIIFFYFHLLLLLILIFLIIDRREWKNNLVNDNKIINEKMNAKNLQ